MGDEVNFFEAPNCYYSERHDMSPALQCPTPAFLLKQSSLPPCLLCCTLQSVFPLPKFFPVAKDRMSHCSQAVVDVKNVKAKTLLQLQEQLLELAQLW